MDFLKFYLKNVLAWLAVILIMATITVFVILGFKYYPLVTSGVIVTIIFLLIIFFQSLVDYQGKK